ncbi:MAG: type II toxin-antitoxin system HicB family antitoxin [Aestuariivirga sp.]|nr:type II toxin-antitoxin system HicB family antitoxin [Aestuariivirga sp.]
MKNVMEYKGYKARIDYDGDDKCFIGHIVGINDVVGFHGTSVDELKAAFEEAVDDYVATCAAVGKQPERSYSGAVMFRVAPEIHASFAQMAELQGKSLNQLGEEVMKQAADAIKATRDPKTGKLDVKTTRLALTSVAERKKRA